MEHINTHYCMYCNAIKSYAEEIFHGFCGFFNALNTYYLFPIRITACYLVKLRKLFPTLQLIAQVFPSCNLGHLQHLEHIRMYYHT